MAPVTPPFEDEEEEVQEAPVTPPFEDEADVGDEVEEAPAEDEFPEDWGDEQNIEDPDAAFDEEAVGDEDADAKAELEEVPLEDDDAFENFDAPEEVMPEDEEALPDGENLENVDAEDTFEEDTFEEPRAEEEEEEKEEAAAEVEDEGIKREEDLALGEVAEHLREAVEGSLKMKRILEGADADDAPSAKRRKVEDGDGEEEMKRETNPQKDKLLWDLRLETNRVCRYVVESADTTEVVAVAQTKWAPNRNHKKSVAEQLNEQLILTRERVGPHGGRIDPVSAFAIRWQLKQDQEQLLRDLTHKELRLVIGRYDDNVALQEVIDEARNADASDAGSGSASADKPGPLTLGRFNRLELIDPQSNALVVGDANLSFSLLLAHHRQDLGHTGRTIATTFELLPTLKERYKEIEETIKQLTDMGSEVLHNVDCTRIGIDSRFQDMGGKFGAVYYNFPHAGAVKGFFDGHPFVRWRHENLMHLFFRALRGFVIPGGSVKVSSNQRAQGVRFSDIIGAASMNEFVHVETVPFPEWTLRNYNRSYGDKRDETRRLKDGEVYAAQKANTDMVYCFCYAPSDVPLAKPRLRYPPTREDMMQANEGALENLNGDRKRKKVEELRQLFLTYIQGIHVG